MGNISNLKAFALRCLPPQCITFIEMIFGVLVRVVKHFYYDLQLIHQNRLQKVQFELFLTFYLSDFHWFERLSGIIIHWCALLVLICLRLLIIQGIDDFLYLLSFFFLLLRLRLVFV